MIPFPILSAREQLFSSQDIFLKKTKKSKQMGLWLCTVAGVRRQRDGILRFVGASRKGVYAGKRERERESSG
jgi:hypothetical protein